MVAAQDNNQTLPNRINPKLFLLWLSFAGITMLFGAFTSAYIVKQGASNWLDINVPNLFYFSTITIVLSSLTMHQAKQSFQKGKESAYKLYLLLTLLLGVTFTAMQYLGWNSMFLNGIDLKANIAGSFFYLITGVHAAHVIGGLGALLACLINAFLLPFMVKEPRRTRIEMMTQYWHFMGALWLYLLVFLIII